MNQVHTKTRSAKSPNKNQSLSATCADECEEQREDFQQLMDEVGEAVVQYCRRRPGVAASCLFAIGFFVGWRVKPW